MQRTLFLGASRILQLLRRLIILIPQWTMSFLAIPLVLPTSLFGHGPRVVVWIGFGRVDIVTLLPIRSTPFLGLIPMLNLKLPTPNLVLQSPFDLSSLYLTKLVSG